MWDCQTVALSDYRDLKQVNFKVFMCDKLHELLLVFCMTIITGLF
jgi:hypothetical protein